MVFILYNLSKIEETKLYFEKSLQRNANLTSILSEKELTIFNIVMND